MWSSATATVRQISTHQNIMPRQVIRSIASFEPGERWFYDYRTEKVFAGPSLVPPQWHPIDQPVPGPDGRVMPPDWESLLHDE
jgi:hypothetical protein